MGKGKGFPNLEKVEKRKRQTKSEMSFSGRMGDIKNDVREVKLHKVFQ